MKPKTKLQIEVWNLHQELSSQKEHEAYVISKHEFYYSTHYKNIVCLECNHSWKPTMEFWKQEVAGVDCPACRKKLRKLIFNNGLAQKVLSYSIVQVVGRFQVFRYFSCWKIMYKNKEPVFHFRSLFEEWKDYDKDKSVIVGRIPTWTGDGFNSADYEVRYINPRAWKSGEYYRFASDINCPNASFLPRFDKYGLREDFHNCDYRYLLRKLNDYSQVETLLKANQKELLFHAVHKDGKYLTYWSQIKIVIRNKYKIDDAGTWYDYLELLKYFQKDLNNPNYICPKDLHSEHNKLVAKKTAIIERKKAEILQDKIAKDLEKFDFEKKAFYGLEFSDGVITVKVLDKIEDYYEEGKKLKHCLFTNNYHLKPDSLIFSARIANEPIETVEISLTQLKLIQARGINNNITVHHDRIVELVNKNLHVVNTIVQKQRKLQKAS